MTASDYARWLAGFRFKKYCPICRCLMYSRNCRQINHFGMRYDFKLERPVVDERKIASWGKRGLGG